MTRLLATEKSRFYCYLGLSAAFSIVAAVPIWSEISPFTAWAFISGPSILFGMIVPGIANLPMDSYSGMVFCWVGCLLYFLLFFFPICFMAPRKVESRGRVLYSAMAVQALFVGAHAGFIFWLLSLESVA